MSDQWSVLKQQQDDLDLVLLPSIGVVMETPAAHPVFGTAGLMVSLNENSVVVDCASQQEFKVGLPNPDGQTLIKYGTSGPWLKCSIPKPSSSDSYAHQLPVEIFNSGDYAYCEAEWHSPQSTLKAGKTITFQQAFQIWSEDDPSTETLNEELRACMS